MSFLHDTIKIKMSTLGYLPDYPPELISDEEMCDGFLKYPHFSAEDTQEDLDSYWETFITSTDTMLFKDYYPLQSDALASQYRSLVEAIARELQAFNESHQDDKKLPVWIYTYMLLSVIGPESPKEDIHDMLVLLGLDNMDDVITPQVLAKCYEISSLWLHKISNTQRPPTIFGEPHVIKSLRLSRLNL